MEQSNPSPSHLWQTGSIAFGLAFLVATQDIIIDAYRIETLNNNLQVQG